MGSHDQIGLGVALIVIGAASLGIDFLVSPENPFRRVLLLTAIVCPVVGGLIMFKGGGS